MAGAMDIRWKQRFRNFDRMVVLLRQALENGPEALSSLEQEGTVQRFEVCFELAWKTMKDWLEQEGVDLASATPRAILKAAFAAGILADGEVWMEMLEHRNLLSHTYDRAVFEESVKRIAGQFLPEIERLHSWFLDRMV
jgi:nucleotidyltransferase substrate binding protein (TIGR01987 family)